jgi:hypothetical protein
VLKAMLLAKGLKPGTVNKVLIILSNALNRAVKWELISRNPARGVTRPKVAGPDYICLTEAQAAALVDRARHAVRGSVSPGVEVRPAHR